MAKVSWKGSISLGIISVPVGAVAVAESAENISFNQMHDKCSARIQQKRICSSCNEEVAMANIVKGYEFTKGQYVIISQQDLDSLKVESDRNLKLTAFVEDDIDPLTIDNSYYLVPDKLTKPYFVIQKALRTRVGIGKVTLFGKERQAILMARGKGLLLQTLHTKAEIRNINELDGIVSAPAVDPEEVEIASMLIDRLTVDEFDLSEFEDSYKAGVRKIIDARIKGEAPDLPQVAEAPKSSTNMLEALKAALAAADATPKKPLKAAMPQPALVQQAQPLARAAHRRTKKSA